MVPVANRPLLEHVIEAVADAGVSRVVLVVGYHQERIRNHFGDGDNWGVTIEYVEQTTQLGTGHAVLQAEALVEDNFVVLNGDRIVDNEIVERVCERAREGTVPAMAVTSAENPREYGVVNMDGDQVTGIDEKPKGPVETSRINAGVYAFSKDVFSAIRETTTAGELALTATLDDLAQANGVRAVTYRGRWLDVSNLWDLLVVNSALIGGESVADEPDSYINESVAVADDVALAGNVRVGPNVTIGGSTSVGSNATIGANAVVENSVVFPDAVIGSGAVVRDAIIAGNARVGPNVTVDGGPSTVVLGDTVHRDVELGGVIGDNATVGGGATLTDGAVVGDAVQADAGVVIDGRVESGAVVRRG